MSRLRMVVPIVVLMILAGCGMGNGGGGTTAPLDTATPTPTESFTPTASPTPAETSTPTSTAAPTATAEPDRPQVKVVNGSLPFDATDTFYRVRELVGASDARPRTVEVRDLTERKGFAPAGNVFLSTLGFRNASLAPDEPGGLTYASTGRVYLHPADGTPDEIERVLAHEFVHTIQFRTGMLPWLDRLDQPRLTTDRILARVMLKEGGAVSVTDAYSQRYQDDVETQSALIAERFRSGNATEKLFWGWYHYGVRYVDGRIDGPNELSTVYDSHPITTEQVLHDYSRDEEPATTLRTTATGSDVWTYQLNNTYGEYYLRTALNTEIEFEAATRAAAGWGNDRVVQFVGSGKTNFSWVWVVEMDNATEADELAKPLETYASRRDGATATSFRTVRVSTDTMALVMGPSSFVEEVTVSEDNETVTVTVSS